MPSFHVLPFIQGKVTDKRMLNEGGKVGLYSTIYPFSISRFTLILEFFS